MAKKMIVVELGEKTFSFNPKHVNIKGDGSFIHIVEKGFSLERGAK